MLSWLSFYRNNNINNTIRSSPTLSSGSWSWNTGERPVILPLRFVYVCCGVLSPGAEMSQYSAILLTRSYQKSKQLKLTWTYFLHTYPRKLRQHRSIRSITIFPTSAHDCHVHERWLILLPATYRFVLEWLPLESIDDSKLPLYGQGDFRFMRKVKVFYSSMAAKGLSHFFQKDKVVEIPYRFVCSVQKFESTSHWLSFRMISMFVCLCCTVAFVRHLFAWYV